MTPSTSVIIPSIGRDTLVRVLSGLEKQTMGAEQYEVIVVLDGHYPDMEKRLSQSSYSFPVRVISQERAGAASARNRGAKEAAGELLIFLDDDIQPDHDLLRMHYDSHSKLDRALVFGHVVVDQKSTNSFLKHHIIRTHQLFFDSCKNGQNEGPYFFCSANFSMRRKFFLDSGGFDLAFRGYGWEEADFGVRIKQQGVPILYLPAAIGKEFYVKGPSDTYRNAREKGRNEVEFTRKHPRYRRFSDLRKAFCGKFLSKVFIRIAWNHSKGAKFLASIHPAGKARFRLRYVQEFWAGVKASGISWSELRESYGRTVPALAYHDIVHKIRPRATYDVRASLFQKQIKMLVQNGYESITVGQYFDWREKGTPLPKKPIFVTIDDGYKSFRSEIAPVLKQNRFNAILFVCPEAVGKENFWDQQRGARKKLLLDWTEIQELGENFEIASHGMTHLDLTTASPQELEYELRTSKDQISARVKPVEALAYPFGAVAESAALTAQHAGYRCAFTAETGTNCVATDPYRLRRIMVRSWDLLPLFYLKLKLAELREH